MYAVLVKQTHVVHIDTLGFNRYASLGKAVKEDSMSAEIQEAGGK